MNLTVRSSLIYLLDLIMAVVGFFLGLRFLFTLLNANLTTPFVAWIYRVSDNLIAPFRGIFPNLDLGGFSIDLVTLVALLAYSIIFSLLTSIIAGISTTRRVYTDDHRHVV